ncbi:hypothetical protein QVD17_04239 [Tagetes erecta]|uniref:Uncharacterized protein n=1 Tax=Tagetes erecta TaxID=13708 RepID=A0AAD8LJ73_TARER|nr:hypothetical protein QVD17_04239 [Tagetes erecta]
MSTSIWTEYDFLGGSLHYSLQKMRSYSKIQIGKILITSIVYSVYMFLVLYAAIVWMFLEAKLSLCFLKFLVCMV